MHVRLLVYRLTLPEARSLKDKRMVIRSLKDRLRNRLNVSVAETADQDIWTRGELSVAYVVSDGRQADSVAESVDKLLSQEGRALITGCESLAY